MGISLRRLGISWYLDISFRRLGIPFRSSTATLLKFIRGWEGRDLLNWLWMSRRSSRATLLNWFRSICSKIIWVTLHTIKNITRPGLVTLWISFKDVCGHLFGLYLLRLVYDFISCSLFRLVDNLLYKSISWFVTFIVSSRDTAFPIDAPIFKLLVSVGGLHMFQHLLITSSKPAPKHAHVGDVVEG